MASFNYRAKTASGETVLGRFDAADRNMVLSLLRSKGYYPVSIQENTAAGKEIRLKSLKRITTRDYAVFCRQFHTMIYAGISVLGCLDLLRSQTENPRFSEIITNIYDSVQKGKTLSDSMKLHNGIFPVMLTSMIEVGETGGSLDEALERLAVHFEKENKMQQKIKTAMTYPAVIGCIALIMVTFMLTFVVPRFVSMFKTFGTQLPAPTRILLGISNLITNMWFIFSLILSIFIIGYFFKKFKESSQGRYILDNLFVNIPVIGKNVRKILASRFTRVLSSLLKTGVPLIQALEVVDRVVGNQMVTKGLVKVKEDIKRGSNLAGPLETIGIFPVMVTQMVSIGEEAGSLDSIMEKVADFYDDEVDTAINRLIALLEPLMIVVMALIIGAIVISMILPVFSMYGNLNR